MSYGLKVDGYDFQQGSYSVIASGLMQGNTISVDVTNASLEGFTEFKPVFTALSKKDITVEQSNPSYSINSNYTIDLYPPKVGYTSTTDSPSELGFIYSTKYDGNNINIPDLISASKDHPELNGALTQSYAAADSETDDYEVDLQGVVIPGVYPTEGLTLLFKLHVSETEPSGVTPTSADTGKHLWFKPSEPTKIRVLTKDGTYGSFETEFIIDGASVNGIDYVPLPGEVYNSTTYTFKNRNHATWVPLSSIMNPITGNKWVDDIKNSTDGWSYITTTWNSSATGAVAINRPYALTICRPSSFMLPYFCDENGTTSGQFGTYINTFTTFFDSKATIGVRISNYITAYKALYDSLGIDYSNTEANGVTTFDSNSAGVCWELFVPLKDKLTTSYSSYLEINTFSRLGLDAFRSFYIHASHLNTAATTLIDNTSPRSIALPGDPEPDFPYGYVSTTTKSLKFIGEKLATGIQVVQNYTSTQFNSPYSVGGPAFYIAYYKICKALTDTQIASLNEILINAKDIDTGNVVTGTRIDSDARKFTYMILGR